MLATYPSMTHDQLHAHKGKMSIVPWPKHITWRCALSSPAPDGFTLRKINTFSELPTKLGSDVICCVSLWLKELWRISSGLPLDGEDEEQEDTKKTKGKKRKGKTIAIMQMMAPSLMTIAIDRISGTEYHVKPKLNRCAWHSMRSATRDIGLYVFWHELARSSHILRALSTIQFSFSLLCSLLIELSEIFTFVCVASSHAQLHSHVCQVETRLYSSPKILSEGKKDQLVAFINTMFMS
jgi:hypothetical protein